MSYKADTVVGGQGSYVRGLRGEDSRIYVQDLLPEVQRDLLAVEGLVKALKRLKAGPQPGTDYDPEKQFLKGCIDTGNFVDWMDRVIDEALSAYRANVTDNNTLRR